MTSKNTNKQAARDAKGRWLPGKSGNPAGRRAGATCHALQMARDAAVEVGLPLLIEKAREGDVEAARVLVAYGLPRLRPLSLPITISLPKTADFSELLRGVLEQAALGVISLDDAATVASIVATAARVEELDSLRDEVQTLKAVLGARDGRQPG